MSGAVAFHNGRPLAPMPDQSEVRMTAEAIIRFHPEASGSQRWIEAGYRNGHLHGWHEGYRAAGPREDEADAQS